MAGIFDIADDLVRGIEGAGATVSETLFEPVIRLGVTGLSRSGKTVFITSLVANLMNRGRMPGMTAAAVHEIEAVYLQPQPDDTVPRFAFEDHMAALSGPTPSWPNSTRHISQLRLSIRLRPRSMLGALTGPRTVHLDIVDYPGEWLLDLLLLQKSYADWSAEALAKARARPQGAGFVAALEGMDPTGPLDESVAVTLSRQFADYLNTARAAGFSDCTPGRFLLPGELLGSPVLTFVPLPGADTRMPRGSLGAEMARRFEAYKRAVIRPFFRNHFARIDRQVVLLDLLGALHAGPPALEDLRQAMADLLSVFKPGTNPFLARLLRGQRVERLLFAATKADHLHHTQHGRLTALADALLAEARDRAAFAGAETRAMSIAALRATVEETHSHNGAPLHCVRGRGDEGEAAWFPGLLPEDPAHVLAPARAGQGAWLDGDYGRMRFHPPRLTLAPGDGPPHIRLDKAAGFLLGGRI